MISRLLSRVLSHETLSHDEMALAMTSMLSGNTSPVQVAAFLCALRMRGETVDELSGAVSAVQSIAMRVEVKGDVVVDTCGTGGDTKGTFNISTAAAIVASACGVTVAKHGNRSVSSKCGSADVLEAFGVRLDLTSTELSQLIALSKLGFLFAPAHHPAFKHVAEVRRELGVRTLFNLVGPLANPARANRQVLGVFDAKLVPLMADVLRRLGTVHALVVHGDGLDEISVCGPTIVSELQGGRRSDYVVTPEELGLQRSPVSDLLGGDAATNAKIIEDILDGQQGAPRDAVVANAGAALLVAGQVSTLRDGVARAARVIDSGTARSHFDRFRRLQHGERSLLDEIVAQIPAPPIQPAAAPRGAATRRLSAVLSQRHGPTRVIAEIKRRSPSAGTIAEIPDPGALAMQYVKQGAAAISVLTNGAHFGGSLDDLRAVRRVVDVPILRKDFVIDPGQLDEAAEVGADAVLLIVSVLGRGLAKMLKLATSLGLEALVEVHDRDELQIALDADASIIGVNNRDLRSFGVDLGISEMLAPLVTDDRIIVAESGIRSTDDLNRLRNSGISNFLVGEFLVRGGQFA